MIPGVAVGVGVGVGVAVGEMVGVGVGGTPVQVPYLNVPTPVLQLDEPVGL